MLYAINRKLAMYLVAVTCAIQLSPSVQAGPMPVGSSTTTVSYTTTAGEQAYSAPINYAGQSLSDAVSLVGAPNIWSFNSVNSFGRRPFLATGGAPVLDTENETAVAHAFFKGFNDDDYFPGIAEGSDVTLNINNIAFDQPVSVDNSTVMLHILWRPVQADSLDSPYSNLHNHHIPSAGFRDLAEFTAPGRIFFDDPTQNYILSDQALSVTFTNNGPNILNLEVAFPYALLQNLEENGQTVPDGLPAPQGFLEPFHFHVEYVVTPEPATLALLGIGACVCSMRGNRRRS